MSVEHVVVEADGGSRGNPGPAGYGAVVMDARTHAVLDERCEAIGRATNNVAEYRGLIAGLEAARDVGARRVSVRMDSKLVIEQMAGRWRVKHPSMLPLARAAQELVGGFADVDFSWIPRAENAHADRLANEAMDRAAGKPPPPAVAPSTVAPSVVAPSVVAPSVVAPSPPPSWGPPSGPSTRLILVRHGATVHSADKRFSGRNSLPLAPTGEAQAAALARRASTFGDVTAVISSPLRRTVQTAEAIAAALGLPVEIMDDLVETDFGAWEGRTVGEVRETQPAELAAWLSSVEVAPPGGESFAQVGRRVSRARDAVLSEHRGGRVVVVTHVTPIKTLVRFALDAPPSALFRIYLDTASVSTLDYTDDGPASLRLLNDTSHLVGLD